MHDLSRWSYLIGSFSRNNYWMIMIFHYFSLNPSLTPFKFTPVCVANSFSFVAFPTQTVSVGWLHLCRILLRFARAICVHGVGPFTNRLGYVWFRIDMKSDIFFPRIQYRRGMSQFDKLPVRRWMGESMLVLSNQSHFAALPYKSTQNQP